MKKSSEIIFLAVALAAAFITPNLFADETAAGPAAGRRKEIRQEVAAKLDLTDAQKASMQSIAEKQRAELQALKADTGLSKEQKREKAKEIMQKYRAERQAVLTPEQQAKMDELQASHPKHGKRRHAQSAQADNAGT